MTDEPNNPTPDTHDEPSHAPPPGERRYWLDDPRNVDKICKALYVVCAALVLADLLYHKHVHFGVDGWFGFYGVFGFVAFVVVVLAGKLLRKLVMRREDYYDH